MHVLDLAHGLRQAGLDGTIQFWGRHRRSSSTATKHEVLCIIDKEFWDKGEIYLFTCFTVKNCNIVGVANDNFKSYVKSKVDDFRSNECCDIHLDKMQAISWLKNESKKYKGTW